MSVCTYQSEMNEYVSTHESTMWIESTLAGSEVCDDMKGITVPVSLVMEEYGIEDERKPKKATLIPIFAVDDIEELDLVPEALLMSHMSHSSFMKVLSGGESNPVPVSLSSYDTKNIVFVLKTCDVCYSESSVDVFVPRRFLKMIARGVSFSGVIECKIQKGGRNDVYSIARVLPGAMKQCKRLIGTYRSHKVNENMTPMYELGYRNRIQLDATICLYLSKTSTVETSPQDGRRVRYTGPRHIVPVVLSVSL